MQSRARAKPGRAGRNDAGHSVSFRRSDPKGVLAFHGNLSCDVGAAEGLVGRQPDSSVPVALGAVGVGVHGQQVQWVDRHGLPVGYVVLAGTSPAAVAAVMFAWGERGKPDIFGANGPAACDCSSLMVAA